MKALIELFAGRNDGTSCSSPGGGETKIGQIWGLCPDVPSMGGHRSPGVAYVYAPDR